MLIMDFGGLGACPQAGVSKGAAAPLALVWVQGGSPAGCGAAPREEIFYFAPFLLEKWTFFGYWFVVSCVELIYILFTIAVEYSTWL